MRHAILLAATCLVLVGCACRGPVIPKSSHGNLEINVRTAGGEPVPDAELYVDGLFVGDLTPRLPVIHARRGERVIRAETEGFVPYEKTIAILGDPNHQVLNVGVEPE